MVLLINIKRKKNVHVMGKRNGISYSEYNYLSLEKKITNQT